MSVIQLDVLQNSHWKCHKKILKKLHLQVLPKYTPKKPLKMSQKMKKIYICQVEIVILQNCHWKCHKKFKKKLPSLVQDIL